jgi:hypothetical protein
MRTVVISLFGDRIEAVGLGFRQAPRPLYLEPSERSADLAPAVWSDGTRFLVGALAERAAIRGMDGALWRREGVSESIVGCGADPSAGLSALTPLIAKAMLFRRAVNAARRDFRTAPSALVVVAPDQTPPASLREIEAACLLAGAREGRVVLLGDVLARMSSAGPLLLVDLLGEGARWTLQASDGGHPHSGAARAPAWADAPPTLAQGATQLGQAPVSLVAVWRGRRAAEGAAEPVVIEASGKPVMAPAAAAQVTEAWSDVWRGVEESFLADERRLEDVRQVVVLAGPANRLRARAPAALRHAAWTDGVAAVLAMVGAELPPRTGEPYEAQFGLSLLARSTHRHLRDRSPVQTLAASRIRPPEMFRLSALSPGGLADDLVLALCPPRADAASIALLAVDNPPSVRARALVSYECTVHAVWNGLALIEAAFVSPANRVVQMVSIDDTKGAFPSTRIPTEVFDAIRWVARQPGEQVD